LRAHGQSLISKLRQEYEDQAESIGELVKRSVEQSKSVYVNLKCTVGPHMGQKFRLEATTASGEDVFKIGRSTGKAFKEKGVSLYKDKEISTTHAKIEVRNGQIFFTDLGSTNGSSVNDKTADAQCPTRLRDGDKVSIGGSELMVQINENDDEALDNVVSF
jgi:pSer/pThr/pTyr-binding forkhead associated (FHA) protein